MANLNNPSNFQLAALGQFGSLYSGNGSALAPPAGKYFIAITMLDDCTFEGSGGLVANDPSSFYNTEAATTNSTGGQEVLDSVTFPKGLTIYGKWTGAELKSGKALFYIG